MVQPEPPTPSLLRLIESRSPLCLGIDPASASLTGAGLPDSVKGVIRFSEALLDAALDSVAAVKPQMAYFERFGPAGLEALARVCRRAREEGVPVIVDAKRGDIGSTMEGYADAYFGPDAPIPADAITLTAYLGLGALAPLFDRMAEAGSAAFVVVCSSNPEGVPLQTAHLADGRLVAEWLADEIAEQNERLGAPLVGGVIGATCGAWARSPLERLRGAPVLAPGLGAQGGTFEQAAQLFAGAEDHVLLPMSRGLLADGLDPSALRERVVEHAELARRFRGRGARVPA
ncbi:MAG: orotidine-5-phosphate decarboxylase [Thermoleophilaceae bacterium]|jgi:orotidine-5'-phosphate decarboxylase|nr:orotidine-5-phosphate decarboxylase [Thermoleophilaceae bacterium]